MQVKKNYIKILILCLFTTLGKISVCQAQTAYMLAFTCKDGTVTTFKNKEKITFRDSLDNVFSGKIYLINDSQFLFLNFYNELTTDTLSINKIFSIFLKSKQPVTPRRTIPASLFIVGFPWTTPVFLIINTLNPIKNKKMRYKITYSEIFRPDFSVKVIATSE